jgi:dihydrolipoamide dehydrogenase
MSDLYDVVVIGGGPAGYPAAIRAGQNKLKVACVDEWINTDGSFAFGGTCLNAGCIPSKALLESSELYQRAKDEFASMASRSATSAGPCRHAEAPRLRGQDHDRRHSRLIQGQRRARHSGARPLLPGNKVRVTGPDGKERMLEAKHVVLASGSVPVRLKNVPHDGNPSSTRGMPWSSTRCRSAWA